MYRFLWYKISVNLTSKPHSHGFSSVFALLLLTGNDDLIYVTFPKYAVFSLIIFKDFDDERIGGNLSFLIHHFSNFLTVIWAKWIWECFNAVQNDMVIKALHKTIAEAEDAVDET